jgi:hypothetical protein
MHHRHGFAELIALAIVIAALIAVMEVPADAATRVEHHHRVTAPYSGYVLEHEPGPDRGFSSPNPDRGPYPAPCNGASC